MMYRKVTGGSFSFASDDWADLIAPIGVDVSGIPLRLTFALVHERCRVAAEDPVRRHLSRLGLDVGNLEAGRHLCGGLGCVFSLDANPGFVLKLTSDQTEAAAASFLMGRTRPSGLTSLPDILSVFSLRPRDLYKGHGWPQFTIYGIVSKQLFEFDTKRERSAAQNFSASLLKDAVATANGDTRAAKRIRRRTLSSYPQAKDFAMSVASLAEAGVVISDMDGYGNILKDSRSTWVIADLGRSTAPSASIPCLDKALARRVVKSIKRS